MQQGILRRPVYNISVDAQVGGNKIALTNYEIERDLPDPFTSSPSFTSASGSLDGIAGPEVTTTVATPWDADTAWPPAGETGVEVTMDVGQGPVTSMTKGRVLGSNGSSSTREVHVEFSDRYQSLDKTITWEPLHRRMPSHESYAWDWTKMRYVSLLSGAITDTILRNCGWHMTPPKIGYTSLSIPATGTMWPEAGWCLTSGRAGGGYPSWGRAPWGFAVGDFVGNYRLAGSYSIKSRGRVELCVMAEPHTTYSRMSVLSPTNAGLFRLQWTSTQAQLYVRNASGAYQQAVAVPWTRGMIYATIEYVSDTQVRCIMRTDDVEWTPQLFTCDPLATTSIADRCDLVIQGLSSGFQVAFPSTSGGIFGWKSNVNYRPRIANANNLIVRPPVEGRNCLELLKEQAEAEAATFWIDEKGIFQWWDLARLEGRDPVETITAATDITDKGFSWEHTDAAVKSRVSVQWTDTLTEMHPEYTITLWQGNGETVQAGVAEEPKEAWIDVPENEVWIMPDTSILRVGTADVADFNNNIGSWYGAIIPGKTETENDRWAYPEDGSFLVTLEQVGITATAFKTTTQWTGSTAVVQQTLGLGTPSTLWKIRRGMDLPIIRGRGKVTTAKRLTYGVHLGPETAPEESIDTKWWLQFPDQAQYLADYVSARVTIPQPVLSSIDVAPMPGLEIGDVVEVFENRVLRATVRGVIVSDKRTIKATDDGITFDQGIALRPTHISANGVLWQEWAAFIRPMAWQGWATTQAGEQWQQWGAAPLE